jgi:hypothetical protein
VLIPEPSLPSAASPVLRTGLALLFLACVGVLAGCYAYVPVVGEDPAPGDDVRFRLAAPAAGELSDRVGRPIRAVEGPLIGLTPDSLRLDVGWGAIYAGTVFEGRRDTLQFHRSQVLEVDRKEFSRTRTGILAAAFGAVVVLVIRAISGGGQGEPTQNGDLPF